MGEILETRGVEREERAVVTGRRDKGGALPPSNRKGDKAVKMMRRTYFISSTRQKRKECKRSRPRSGGDASLWGSKGRETSARERHKGGSSSLPEKRSMVRKG